MKTCINDVQVWFCGESKQYLDIFGGHGAFRIDVDEQVLQFAYKIGLSYGSDVHKRSRHEVLEDIFHHLDTTDRAIFELRESIRNASSAITLKKIYEYGLSIGIEIGSECVTRIFEINKKIEANSTGSSRITEIGDYEYDERMAFDYIKTLQLKPEELLNGPLQSMWPVRMCINSQEVLCFGSV